MVPYHFLPIICVLPFTFTAATTVFVLGFAQHTCNACQGCNTPDCLPPAHALCVVGVSIGRQMEDSTSHPSHPGGVRCLVLLPAYSPTCDYPGSTLYTPPVSYLVMPEPHQRR